MKLKQLIGNKTFYKMLFIIALPIMIQQGITSFVNLLDNIMVGRLGTEEMAGVAIANQLLFVYNLCIFGSLSGAAIFSAQFFGANNLNGVRSCFRFKIYTAIVIVIISSAVLIFLKEPLIYLFLHGEELENIELAFKHGNQYLTIMLLGLLPFAVSQVYSSTLRETKDTVVPMVSSLIAVFLNLILNFLLIFGYLGFPRMGVMGAALASVISRFVEMGILIIYTHTHSHKYHFIQGIFKTMKVPLELVYKITKKGLPLFFNELLWATGMTVLFMIYSLRGYYVVAAFNISATASNLFIIFILSLGISTSIIIGQLLGAGKLDEAKETSRKILFFAVIFSIFIAIIFISISFFIPALYKTDLSVKRLANYLMIVAGISYPIHAFNMCCYFTLRAGGVSIITFLFDSVFAVVVSIPVALILVLLTPMNIIFVYLLVQLADIIKSSIGFILIKKGIWINNLVYAST